MKRFLAAALLAGLSATAQAQAPLVITVPVDINSWSGRYGLRVSCRVGPGPNALGKASVVPILLDSVHGSFKGNLTVPIDSRDPSVVFYRCELVQQDYTGMMRPVGPGNAKPGTPVTISVSGPIKR